MSGKELQRRFSHVFGLQTKGLSISFSSSLRANTWKEQMETQKQMGKHIFICLMNRKNVRFFYSSIQAAQVPSERRNQCSYCRPQINVEKPAR